MTKTAWTYVRNFAAHYGRKEFTVVTIPDQVADDQRGWDHAGNHSFPAIRSNGRVVRVRLDPEAYDLHGSGTGDCVVRSLGS
jgi:hypothetical protein